jgi:hypothetical protein
MNTKIVGAVMLLIAATLATGPVAAQKDTCDTDCVRAKVDRHLLLMGEYDNEEQLEASLRALVAAGPQVVEIAAGTYEAWSRVELPEPDGGVTPGEMRWRAVYLLGSLGMRDAVRNLYSIAQAPLPRPELDEDAFGDEVRIRLRAVAGLENLGAVDELRRLYDGGGVLRNSTAASLFVLGVNVGGVYRTDARTALAEEKVDSKDYNPNQGRPAQPELPGSPTFQVTPRRDTPATPKN